MHDPEEPDQNESPPGLTRRDFLSHAGSAGLAGLAASMPLVAAATDIGHAPPEAPEIPGTVPVALASTGRHIRSGSTRVPRCSTRGACTVHASRLVALFAI